MAKEKISKEPLEKFKVVLLLMKPTPKVLAVVDNCLESFIPFLIKHEHRRSIEAWAFDADNKRAGIYKIHESLDLLQLYKKCNRSVSFDDLLTTRA